MKDSGQCKQMTEAEAKEWEFKSHVSKLVRLIKDRSVEQSEDLLYLELTGKGIV